uniref:Uncharacterized protein n=1 Tax=Ditylenchus dipsaci TaxID=166011 RepID=A0A915DMX1_9BILA
MELETDEEDRCVGRSTGDHTHCTSKADIEVTEFSKQIPELARQGHQSGRQIFTSLIENVSDKAKSRLVQHNISRRVYYYRQKQSKDPTTPRNPEDLEIPAELLLYKGQLFVMHDTGKEDAESFSFQLQN